MIYLDTHVAAWLYAGRVDLFTTRGRRLVDDEELRISPAVILELEYLHEIGRLRVRGSAVAHGLSTQKRADATPRPLRSSIARSTRIGREMRSIA